MKSKKKSHITAGALLVLAGVLGAITLDESKYSLICLLGVVFLLMGTRSKTGSA